MKLTKEQTQGIIDNAKAKGLNGKDVLDGLIKKGYEPEGIDVAQAKSILMPQEAPSTFERVKTGIEKKGEKIVDILTDTNKNPLQAGVEATATGFSALSSTVYNALPDSARQALDKIGGGLGKGFNYLTDKISNSQFLQEAMQGDTAKLTDALKIASDLGLISGEIAGAKGVADVGNLAVNTVKKGVEKITTPTVNIKGQKYTLEQLHNQRNLDSKFFESLTPDEQLKWANFDKVQSAKLNLDNAIKNKAPKTDIEDLKQIYKNELSSKEVMKVSDPVELRDRLVEFASPDADDATKTILKESTPDEIDRFVKLQEKATIDPRATTPYESVGDDLSIALKELNKIKKEIGVKKADFLSPTKAGLDPFDTKNFIDDLTVLKNRTSKDLKPFVQKIIDEAKTVKTKGGMDRFIDDVQDKLYRSGKDLTLPQGSALDKQLRGVVEKANNSLKATLPPEYSALNAEYSKLIKATTALNKSLGEVVDGVSTRGGSLVKQFFSPNGRKAKVLFEYVKQNTGIDLAKNATLAKYVMELYQDPRVNTLLGGNIPTSVSGIINQLIDFGVEKSGIGKTIQKTLREGAIKKAKSLTTATNP